jgi:5'-nucleotidase / UDP-sugar diphosphatase
VSGIQFAYDVNLPPGQRILEVIINGEPLDKNRLYKVATVDYMFNGGDGYVMLKEGRVILSPLQKVDLVGTLAKYIKSSSSLHAELEGRIVVKESSRKLDDANLPI